MLWHTPLAVYIVDMFQFYVQVKTLKTIITAFFSQKAEVVCDFKDQFMDIDYVNDQANI